MKIKNSQKSLASIAVAALSLSSSVNAQDAKKNELSDGDRIAIMEKLEKIQEFSNERVSGLYSRAIKDYRAAISSDTETMKLYLLCCEKINFKDKHKKSSEFREWKKKNDDKLDSTAFRMALRLQLSWLLLSIETASQDGDVTEMGGRAIGHINTIFENAKTLKGQEQILKEDALSSLFAKAYELNIKIKDWPKSALDIENVYEKLVMPPLRNEANIDSLRKAWGKKILHLGTAVEAWSERKGTSIGMKSDMRSPQMEKFIEETRPKLIWDMEKDCFEAGGEREAALNMLKHLETHVKSKHAPKWIEEFEEYINPEGGESEVISEVMLKE